MAFNGQKSFSGIWFGEVVSDSPKDTDIPNGKQKECEFCNKTQSFWKNRSLLEKAVIVGITLKLFKVI